jgi:polyhydroxyalkanoate synthesis repressor PhaR
MRHVILSVFMDPTATDAPKTRRVIKRYANRKLYDTRESRYVTLQQIAEMIKGGDDVLIIDNNSKEDLTSVTLAQIIYEQEKAATQRLPTALRDFIQTGSERLMASIREGRRLIRRDGEVDELGGPAPAEAGAPAPEAEPSDGKGVLDGLMDWQKKLDERVRSTLSAWKPFLQMQGEVRRLSQRIEELEARLTGASRKGKEPDGKPE